MTARLFGVVCLVLGASALLSACADTTDSTFSCTGGSTSMTCAAGTQYCEQVVNAGTVTGATCRVLPTTCSGNPCSNCLMAGTNGIIECRPLTFGTIRSASVSVRN